MKADSEPLQSEEKEKAKVKSGSELSRPVEFTLVGDYFDRNPDRQITFVYGPEETGKREMLTHALTEKCAAVGGKHVTIDCSCPRKPTHAGVLRELSRQADKIVFSLRNEHPDPLSIVIREFIRWGIRAVTFVNLHDWGVLGAKTLVQLTEVAKLKNATIDFSATSIVDLPKLYNGGGVPHSRFTESVHLRPLNTKSIHGYLTRLPQPFPTIATLDVPRKKGSVAMAEHLYEVTAGSLGLINQWIRRVKAMGLDDDQSDALLNGAMGAFFGMRSLAPPSPEVEERKTPEEYHPPRPAEVSFGF
jgi:hypothetical protein